MQRSSNPSGGPGIRRSIGPARFSLGGRASCHGSFSPFPSPLKGVVGLSATFSGLVVAWGQGGVSCAARCKRVSFGGRSHFAFRPLGSFSCVGSIIRLASGCAGSSVLSRRELLSLICSSRTSAGGRPDSRCSIGIGVVRHTGSTARAAVRMAMSIFATCFPRPLLIDSPSLFRDGQERPGHQASAPYVATGRTHAAAALAVASGGDPFVVRFKLLR